MKKSTDQAALLPRTREFYVSALDALDGSRIPFMVGGAFALNHYTSIVRLTKDFDVFVHRGDAGRVLRVMHDAGFRTEMTFPHWLAKAMTDDDLIDVIFSSGNGIAEVDEEWFQHAETGDVLGRRVRIVPPEEMIWSKGYVMERERFDGADVNHLLLACAETIDWTRLVRRFGSHWRILLAHLVLFGFVYPQERDRIPTHVLRELTSRLHGELTRAAPDGRVCQGTLISSRQYQGDVDEGLVDARLVPYGHMSQADIDHWIGMLEKGDA